MAKDFDWVDDPEVDYAESRRRIEELIARNRRRAWRWVWLSILGLAVSSYFLTFSDWVLIPFAISGALFMGSIRQVWKG